MATAESYEWDCRVELCSDDIAALLIGESGRMYLMCDGCLRSAIRDDEVMIYVPGEPLTLRTEPFTIHGTHVLKAGTLA